MPFSHPSSNLTIANLPPDLRGQGEELRDEYFALLGEAGLLTEEGAVDLGRLNDLETVKTIDLATLRAIAESADKLEDLGGPVRQSYRTLRAVFQQDCPFEEFRSPAFVAEAASEGFSPFQWAQVRHFKRENGTGLRFTPQGPKDLLLSSNLALRGWRITTLPDNLTSTGELELTDCTALTTLPRGFALRGALLLSQCTALTTLPEDLKVGGHLYVVGCSEAVIAAARALKNAGRIGGEVRLSF